MSKSVRAVLLILVIIVIPLLINAFLQIKSLDEDEKMAQRVYRKQMETVLFSLNQYADDMMSQWIRRLTNEQNSLAENASELTLGNESIQMLVLRNIADQDHQIYLNDYVSQKATMDQNIHAWYDQKDSVISSLTDYLSAGFQKIQPVDGWTAMDGLNPNQTGLMVMLYDKDSVLYNALLILEPNYWVEQILGPKMQQIDQDDFRLAVFHESGQSPLNEIYNTDPFDLEKSMVKKELWILPDTYLAIQPKGESYTDLIKARSKNNLYFLLFSLITMLVGAVLIIKNMNSALKIAQLKSDFVSNVSHEIRTPLSLIRMYAETLMLGRLPSEEKKKHYYQIIHHESGRLTYLVNNILDFSRIEANRKTYDFQIKDLNELVKGICESYTYYLKENDVKLEVSLSANALDVSVDIQAFEEALSNLIENATKYSNQQKCIRISTYEESTKACCSVTDEGIGISKKSQKHIFEKFYRVEDALTQKTQGTGLGLSLVKHMMTSHHGEITVDSELNQGSTFTLKFPINQNSK